jgi:hypothetical protein
LPSLMSLTPIILPRRMSSETCAASGSLPIVATATTSSSTVSQEGRQGRAQGRNVSSASDHHAAGGTTDSSSGHLRA